MPIRQIQITNDSVEDRLILRIGTDANEEIRVFLTRRFLRDIWPHLTAMLAGHLSSAPLIPTEVSDDVDIDAPDQASSFEPAFLDDNPTYPLGAKPLLATEAVLEANGENAASLTLREGRERSFKLNLNPELLQVLCAMLRAANEHAEWNLVLDTGSPAPMANAPTNSLLH